MTHVLSRPFAFVWGHRLHILVAPLMALTAITLAHELSHGLFVVLQGGVVHELSIVPDGNAFGWIRYTLPEWGDGGLVAFGPTLVFAGVMACTATLGLVFGPVPGPAARTLFVWGYLAPLADIAWSALPWLAGEQNDLSSALGQPDDLWLVAWGACFAAAGGLGLGLVRRLYGPAWSTGQPQAA